MLNNKENIIVVDDWVLSDLYDPDFWNKSLKILSDFQFPGHGNFSEAFANLINNNNPIIQERLRKDQLIEFLWDIIPSEYKISFFENEYAVYYIWSSEISLDSLVKLHDLLINRQFNRIPDHISSTSIYKKIVESRNKAYLDMDSRYNTKDKVLMQFYDRLQEEKVISLNTSEYVMVSGIDKIKVNILRDKLLKEKYILLYTMEYQYGDDYIPILVFQPLKKEEKK